MNVNINVKKIFKVNGKEYNSIEKMPPDIRNAFEKAMAGQADTVLPSLTQTKIIFNGIEYKIIDDMPSDVRQLYEKAINAIQSGDIQAGIQINGDISGSKSVSKTFTNNMGMPDKIEPTAFSTRLLIIGIVLIGLIIMFYLVFQGK